MIAVSLDVFWRDVDGSIFVAILLSVFTYLMRKRWDDYSMRLSLARMLYNELTENRQMLMTMRYRGMSGPAMTTSSVYGGLLTSGNMRYLQQYQQSLYSLYSAQIDDPDMVEYLETVFKDIELASRSLRVNTRIKFSIWTRGVLQNPLLQTFRRLRN